MRVDIALQAPQIVVARTCTYQGMANMPRVLPYNANAKHCSWASSIVRCYIAVTAHCVPIPTTNHTNRDISSVDNKCNYSVDWHRAHTPSLIQRTSKMLTGVELRPLIISIAVPKLLLRKQCYIIGRSISHRFRYYCLVRRKCAITPNILLVLQ
jgi:hypothetical protein